MEYLKIGVFIACVFLTLDYITDTIEALSGRSKYHIQLKQTKSDFGYMALVVFFWGLLYALESLQF